MDEIGEFFEKISVKTSLGTPIFGSTRKAFEDCLDAYYYGQRTGVIIMDEVQRLPITKLAARAGCGVEDKVKIMSQFEKEYDVWLRNRPVAFSTPIVEAEFAKEIKGHLHSILSKTGNRMKMDRLATIYAVQTNRELTDAVMDRIARNIRAYALTDHAFSVGRGGFASVYRLLDTKGKETGVAMEDGASTSAPRSHKVLERYTKSVKALGFVSKDQFLRAKKSGANTVAELRAWIGLHG